MNDIVKILMKRDGMTQAEAEEVVNELRERVLNEGADPEEELYEIGLELDYLFDIL